MSEYWKNRNIEQKRISSAGQTSAGQTAPRYPLLFNIPFFQYSLIHDLALIDLLLLINLNPNLVNVCSCFLLLYEIQILILKSYSIWLCMRCPHHGIRWRICLVVKLFWQVGWGNFHFYLYCIYLWPSKYIFAFRFLCFTRGFQVGTLSWLTYHTLTFIGTWYIPPTHCLCLSTDLGLGIWI